MCSYFYCLALEIIIQRSKTVMTERLNLPVCFTNSFPSNRKNSIVKKHVDLIRQVEFPGI